MTRTRVPKWLQKYWNKRLASEGLTGKGKWSVGNLRAHQLDPRWDELTAEERGAFEDGPDAYEAEETGSDDYSEDSNA